MTVLYSVMQRATEEAAALSDFRSALVASPSRTLHDLRAHDLRIEAHLDGLRVDSNEGWRAASTGLEEGAPGALFPATVLALESGTPERIDAVLAAALADPRRSREFLSGCAWLPYPQASRAIRHLLAHRDALSVHLAVTASGLHRQDPGSELQGAVAAGDAATRARAWRVAGWIRRRDVLGSAWKAYADESPEVRFAAGFAGPLLGDLNGITVLQQLSVSDWPRREEAARLAVRALEPGQAIAWQRDLAMDPGLARVAVAAAGSLGDPGLVPWLSDLLDDPALARVAGEAIATTTGVRIVADGCEGARREGFDAGPTDDPADENVAMDPDEFLPWPDPEKLRAWWVAHESRFRPGVRHLLGRPVSADAARHALVHGTQREREAAAFEAALLDPQQPVFEVRAPARRQMQLLGIAAEP